jgi:hypothetical protein
MVRRRSFEYKPGLVTASKAPSFQPLYCKPLPRQALQAPNVCAVAALRQLAASWTTRGLLNVNIDQESVVNMLDPIQYQGLWCKHESGKR